MASRKTTGEGAATVSAAEGAEKVKKTRAPAATIALDFSDEATLDSGELPTVQAGRRSQWGGQLEQLMVATQEGQVKTGADGLPKWVRLSCSPNLNHGSAAVKNIKEKNLYPGGAASADLFEVRHSIRTDASGNRFSEVWARYVGG